MLANEALEVVEALEVLSERVMSDELFTTWSQLLDKYNDLYIRALWDHYGDTSREDFAQKFEAISQLATPRADKADQQLSLKASTYKTENPTLKRIITKKTVDASLSTEANLALETEIGALVSSYQSLTSQQTVELEEPVTLARVRARLRQEPNRDKREWLWRQRERRRAEDFPQEEELFLQLLRKRRELAKNAGFSTFRDFIWQAKHRTDYTPEDTLQLLDDVQDIFGDVQDAFAQYLADSLGVKQLRPWDLEVTQSSTPHHSSFSEAEFNQITRQALTGVSPEFAPTFDRMQHLGHVDLMTRPNKVGMNYSTTLTTMPDPFVMCSATGAPVDLRVILHEFGHALHYAAVIPGKLFFDKIPPVEISEFVAYTIQILGSEELGNIGLLSPQEVKGFQLYVLDVVLRMLRTYDRVERFQHWLYEQERSISDLDETWLALASDPGVDWSGLEAEQAKGWHHHHIFSFPFYSIEYVISWLAALVITDRAQRDPSVISENFLTLLTYGGTKGVRETLAAVNIDFPFNRAFVREAHDALKRNFMSEL